MTFRDNLRTAVTHRLAHQKATDWAHIAALTTLVDGLATGSGAQARLPNPGVAVSAPLSPRSWDFAPLRIVRVVARNRLDLFLVPYLVIDGGPAGPPP
jgi:hypothetical protein